MASTATAAVARTAPSHWFWEFLREELAPYPERVHLVGRMVLSATLVMIVCMAFRIPYAFQGAIFALMISRESTQATLKSVLTTVLATMIGAVFVIGSAWFFTLTPSLHFIWIAFALFVTFFALSTINNYLGVVMFAVMIVVAIPLWDRVIPVEINLEDTLWLVWSSMVGSGIATAVELAFARLRPGDNVIVPIAERLEAVRAVLQCYADGRPLDTNAQRQINRYALLGTSLARRASVRSGYSLPYVAQTGGMISLIGSLVDATAALTQLAVRPGEAERRRARELVAQLAQLRSELIHRQIPAPINFDDLAADTPGFPLLRELEQTVQLIPQVFAAPPPERLDPGASPPTAPLLVHDAFSNPAHLRVAVKGVLATMLCYVFYKSVDWPGISTSVVTCVLTALTTVGSSRQKQVLRFAGALVGGFAFGMGAQIFILPYIDTIFGFTIVFAIVTAISAWFMTASPRLSYFGVQVALAFYLIHLQEYKLQTSLSIARDRAVGVLVGLFAMWLVFDQLWGESAGVEMRKNFITNLRLMAQFAREPDMGDRKDAIRRVYALGQTINANLDQEKSLSDAVLFEFGGSRAADLLLRALMKEWHPRLRSLFLVRGALLRYRLEFRGFELPQQMEPAQGEFDTELSNTLDGMADRLEGKPPRSNSLDTALTDLAKDASACSSDASPHLEDFLTLSRTAGQLAMAVERDIAREHPIAAQSPVAGS